MLKSLRERKIGQETVYHLIDRVVYRTLCERLKEEGYDFPQCIAGVDVEYGLRSVLILRRLKDQAEVTVWLDVPYDHPHVPSVTDLWGGVEWHEREAYDLVGIHYDSHPDLRRILTEADWTIHPLQRRYDTGGYLIPDWRPKPWLLAEEEAPPNVAKPAAAEREARKERPSTAKAAEKKPTKPAQPVEDDLTRIEGITPQDEAKLKARGIKTYARIAKLNDKATRKYAAELDFGNRIVDEKWREQAAKLMRAP